MNPYFKRILLWVIWLCAGCVFYKVDLNTSYSKGLYYSVLVGYNIGWNFEEETHLRTQFFSIGHMIIGVVAVTILVEEYLQNILNADTEWYHAVIERENYVAAVGIFDRIKLYYVMHKSAFIPVSIWVGILVGGAIAGYIFTDWSGLDSCFYTISTLFAAGFVQVPDKFSNFQYFCVSLFAGVGVPLTLYCFGALAALYVSSPHSDKFASVCKTCDISDLKTMQRLGLENGDGHVDHAEYLILCMLRLRAIDPELIEAINLQYQALDTDKNGYLEYAELLEVNVLEDRQVYVRGSKVNRKEKEKEAEKEAEKETDKDIEEDMNDNVVNTSLELEPCNLDHRFSHQVAPIPPSSSSASRFHQVSDRPSSSHLLDQGVLPSPSTRGRRQQEFYRPSLDSSHEQFRPYSLPLSHSTYHPISPRPTPILPPPPPDASPSVSMSAGVLLAQRVASMKKERQNRQDIN